MLGGRRDAGVRRPRTIAWALGRGLIAATLSLVPLVGCIALNPRRTVSTEELERGSQYVPQDRRRVVISYVTQLGDAYVQLSPRLGLIQVRTVDQWRQFAAATRWSDAAPNLADGRVVGLAYSAGTPVDGEWPVELQGVRACGDAGLLLGRLHGGSYLPDGATYAELTYVKKPCTILMVDVGGARFFPKQ